MDKYEICMTALIVFALSAMAGLLMASISALYCVDYACGVLGCAHPQTQKYVRDRCSAAIEAAGVKVKS